VALQAAWERACKTSGKKCIRGVVDESKLLTSNPWSQFTWIEGFERPLRQFDGKELVGLHNYLDRKWPGVTIAKLLAKLLLWSCGRRAEITALTWQQLREVGQEHHFQVVGKWGIKKWFRVPEGLYQELLNARTDSEFVLAAYNDQLRQFYEAGSRRSAAKTIGSEFSPACLGDWFYERLVKWSADLPKGHAHTHIFRKTSLQYARRGEDVISQVAKDARVTGAVMMKHYVEENYPEMRAASNRTFERILASLPPDVAVQYGHVAAPDSSLEARLQAAIAAKDWDLATAISSQLSKKRASPAG